VAHAAANPQIGINDRSLGKSAPHKTSLNSKKALVWVAISQYAILGIEKMRRQWSLSAGEEPMRVGIGARGVATRQIASTVLALRPGVSVKIHLADLTYFLREFVQELTATLQSPPIPSATPYNIRGRPGGRSAP
jgi:hypothetical protein